MSEPHAVPDIALPDIYTQWQRVYEHSDATLGMRPGLQAAQQYRPEHNIAATARSCQNLCPRKMANTRRTDIARPGGCAQAPCERCIHRSARFENRIIVRQANWQAERRGRFANSSQQILEECCVRVRCSRIQRPDNEVPKGSWSGQLSHAVLCERSHILIQDFQRCVIYREMMSKQ